MCEMLKVNTTLTGLFFGCKSIHKACEIETCIIFDFFSTGDNTVQDDHDNAEDDVYDYGYNEYDEDEDERMTHHGIDKSCADLLTAIWNARAGDLVV